MKIKKIGPHLLKLSQKITVSYFFFVRHGVYCHSSKYKSVKDRPIIRFYDFSSAVLKFVFFSMKRNELHSNINVSHFADRACTQAGPTSSVERMVAQHTFTHASLINESSAALTNFPHPCGLVHWANL